MKEAKEFIYWQSWKVSDEMGDSHKCWDEEDVHKAIEIAYLEGMLSVEVAINSGSMDECKNNCIEYYTFQPDESRQEIEQRLKQLTK